MAYVTGYGCDYVKGDKGAIGPTGSIGDTGPTG